MKLSHSIRLSSALSKMSISYSELQPDFQRMGGIWDDGKQSRRIHAIAHSFARVLIDASDERVIDGLQRLTA